jgi:hypothetical protein
VIFRISDRSIVREDDRRAPHDEVLTAAERTFGRCAEIAESGAVSIDGHTFVYRPGNALPFVLRPGCAQCGTDALEQFSYERTEVLGAPVQKPVHGVCRDCRFFAAAAATASRSLTVASTPQPVRRRTRRYRQADRVAG